MLRRESTLSLSIYAKQAKAGLLAILFICLFAASAHAQATVEGFWRGAFSRDGAVQLINVEFFREGGREGRIEMPDHPSQNAASRCDIRERQVSFPLLCPPVAFDEAAGELGTVAKIPRHAPLHLKRAVNL